MHKLNISSGFLSPTLYLSLIRLIKQLYLIWNAYVPLVFGASKRRQTWDCLQCLYMVFRHWAYVYDIRHMLFVEYIIVRVYTAEQCTVYWNCILILYTVIFIELKTKHTYLYIWEWNKHSLDTIFLPPGATLSPHVETRKFLQPSPPQAETGKSFCMYVHINCIYCISTHPQYF